MKPLSRQGRDYVPDEEIEEANSTRKCPKLVELPSLEGNSNLEGATQMLCVLQTGKRSIDAGHGEDDKMQAAQTTASRLVATEKLVKFLLEDA